MTDSDQRVADISNGFRDLQDRFTRFVVVQTALRIDEVDAKATAISNGVDRVGTRVEGISAELVAQATQGMFRFPFYVSCPLESNS